MPINTTPMPLRGTRPAGPKNDDAATQRPAGGPNPDVHEATGPSRGRGLGDVPMSGEATRLEAAGSPVPGFSQEDIRRGYKPAGSAVEAAKSDPKDFA